MSPSDAADYLSLRVDQVRRMVRAHELPAHNISPGARPTWRIRPEELDAWLEQRRTGPPAHRR